MTPARIAVTVAPTQIRRAMTTTRMASSSPMATQPTARRKPSASSASSARNLRRKAQMPCPSEALPGALCPSGCGKAAVGGGVPGKCNRCGGGLRCKNDKRGFRWL